MLSSQKQALRFKHKPKPRKVPVQTRSRATVEAILEATARILEAEGLEAVTTNRVAERAGVSIGSLYQYFPDRDAVLAALIRREDAKLKQKFAEIAGHWTEPYSAAEALIDALIGHKFMRPQLAMALDRLELPLGLEQEEQEGLRSTAVLVGRLVQGLAPDAGPRADPCARGPDPRRRTSVSRPRRGCPRTRG